MVLSNVLSADGTALSGGGFLDTPNQRFAIRQLVGVYRGEDLAEIVVDYRSGSPLRLRDVADVVESFPTPIGDAVINDVPGLLLIVEKQPWGNTLEVTRNVEIALETLRPDLKDLEVDATIFRPATFIERSSAESSPMPCGSAVDWSWSFWRCSCLTGGLRLSV